MQLRGPRPRVERNRVGTDHKVSNVRRVERADKLFEVGWVNDALCNRTENVRRRSSRRALRGYAPS